MSAITCPYLRVHRLPSRRISLSWCRNGGLREAEVVIARMDAAWLATRLLDHAAFAPLGSAIQRAKITPFWAWLYPGGKSEGCVDVLYGVDNGGALHLQVGVRFTTTTGTKFVSAEPAPIFIDDILRLSTDLTAV